MAKLDIRSLNYITSSKKQNTFNIDVSYTNDGHIAGGERVIPAGFNDVHHKTFFGNVGEEETMSQKYDSNRESLYDINNKIIIHNMYDMAKVKLKQTASGSHNSVDADIFAPSISTDVIGMCQLNDYAYGLTERTDQHPSVLSISLNNKSVTDYSYHYQYAADGTIGENLYPELLRDLSADMIMHGIPEDRVHEISTYSLYVTDGGKDPELSSERVKNIFDIRRKLSGIKHNYLLEIPENSQYNDYSTGCIMCNAVIAKNHLDSDYSMNAKSATDQLGDYKIGLSSVREYVGIEQCGGRVFLKYRDNIAHQLSDDNVQLSADDGKFETHQLSSEMRTPYSYQHVEEINSMNKFTEAHVGHKSSMYSIRLLDTGLNSSSISQTTKSKLRQNIANSIRLIAEKICPANTQLFQIYFEGK